MYRETLAFGAGVLLCCLVGSAAVGGEGRRAVCEDTLQNCADYGNAVCTQYAAWAHDNCAKFCAFCSSGSAVTSQPGGAVCVDALDNCAALGPDVCTAYVEFVQINCRKTCSLCGGASGNTQQCVDKISNCAAYGTSACNGQYQAWAKDNCQHTCNLCPAGGGDSVVNGVSDVCYYSGQAYKEGQSWKDGCDKNCTCVDAHRGYYLCKELCPTYDDLPAGCTMVTPPGECCAKPQCPPAQSGCLYKGQVHAEGEQFKDGCDYLCTCKDGKTGYYECRALCVTWNLPAVCHLANAAPGKCCRDPVCPPSININYPPGYVPM